MKIPQSIRNEAYERADMDSTVMCEAMIRLPPSFRVPARLCFGRANNLHHRINQSQGGLNVLSNLLVLCGSGTTGCHGWVTLNPLLAKEFGWAVHPKDDPLARRVMYRGRWARLTDEGGVEYGNGDDEEKQWT